MEIKGNGFLLRRWKRDDATELQRLADNPKIAANLYNRFPSPYAMEDARFFINLKIDEDPVTSFVIEIDGRFAGTIGIELREDVYEQSPLIGYWLGEDFWGKGVMTEATKLMTDYALAYLILFACKPVCSAGTRHLCGYWKRRDIQSKPFYPARYLKMGRY